MKRQSMVLVCILLVSVLAQAEPPPFGTVVQRWPLQMGGPYAGSGITWVRDSGKFYLMDQGYAGTIRVWNLDPADPEGSIAQVPWTFLDLGEPREDISWGLAWDPDSGCFWISQIVDGDIYGGCYLLRHVWNGSRWVWGGASGDSWFVGDGSNGGGLRCLWVAGMEKNDFTGSYYFTPVHSSPSPMNHIGKFDPYTKTNLGRLPYGDSVAARGLTLIPWDSAYILTSGWSSGLVKRDTLGRIVQRADSGGGGAADMAVEVPNQPEPDSTVWFYMISSNSSNYLSKVSTGLSWRQLPSAFGHTARPDEMLAPVGMVDSGETVVPRLVVRNHAEVTADSVSVHFLIDDGADRVIYHDSLVVTLAPGSVDTIEFAAWTPTGRDSMGALAWTWWDDDSVPEDDTLLQRFLVRVKDVGITAVNEPTPGDTIDQGAVYSQVELYNYGNLTMTFPVIFNIGVYFDTVWVVNLLAGGGRTVTAQNPWNATAGTWLVNMRAHLAGDQRPQNNDTSFVLIVRGDVEHDIQFEAIHAPVDSQLVGDTVRPWVRLANYGVLDEEFWTYFRVIDTDSATTYLDSVPVFLHAGGNTHVVFAPLIMDEQGWFAWACSAHVDSGCVVVVRDEFWVIDPVGMKERSLKPSTFGISEVRPNPFVSGAVVRFGLPEESDVDIAVFSAGGRRVKGLTKGVLGPGYHRVVWDGKDDAGLSVSRGVYCLRLAAGGHVVSRRMVKLE